MYVPAALLAAGLALAAPTVARAGPQVLRAAPVGSGMPETPRRLFNAGLGDQENDDVAGAIRHFLAARLAPRSAFADELYARGAALRLVRLLAGIDDDAAAAAAILAAPEVADDSTDLAPLIRTLLARLSGGQLEIAEGVIHSLRFRRETNEVIVELHRDEGAPVLARVDAPIGPFTAGDAVRLVMRRESRRALAGWRVVALGFTARDGWDLLVVRGI